MGDLVSSIANVFTGADDTRDAANAAASQQRRAAEAAAFRPVGMTTRFGTSSFTRTIDPKTKLPYISAADYEAAPELSALQDRLFGQFGAGLTSAEQTAAQYAPLSGAASGLMNLGQQYIAQSPEETAQNYIKSQQGLLAGGREQQLAGIRNRLFQTGRGGLATGGTETGMQATNPEMAAYYNALAQQDAQIAAQAEQAGQQRTQFGASLFGTGAGLLGAQTQGQMSAYSPLQNILGLSNTVESMALQPYQLGIQLGQAQQPGQQAFMSGMNQAAQTQYQGAQAANAANSAFLSSLIGAAAGGMSGGGGGGAMFGGGTQTFGQYTRNLGSFQGGGVGANSWENYI